MESISDVQLISSARLTSCQELAVWLVVVPSTWVATSGSLLKACRKPTTARAHRTRDREQREHRVVVTRAGVERSIASRDIQNERFFAPLCGSFF